MSDFDSEFTWYAQTLFDDTYKYAMYFWSPITRLNMIEWCKENLQSPVIVRDGGGTMVQGNSVFAYSVSIITKNKDDAFLIKLTWG